MNTRKNVSASGSARGAGRGEWQRTGGDAADDPLGGGGILMFVGARLGVVVDRLM
jgi:hypothetical protein